MIALLLALLIPIAAAENMRVSILDGDTIDTNGQRYRLYGIDAPEIKQPHGVDAAHALRAAMDDRDINVQSHGKGKYGRVIALLQYRDRGTTVQARLVSEGWAWVYPQYCDIPACDSWERLERIAREQGRGLWANDDPMPPWEWRRQ